MGQLVEKDIQIIDQKHGERYSLYHADCCEAIKLIGDEKVHYIWTSIPFLSIFVYSPSERDMGNCRSREEFWDHFAFLTEEIYRVMMPGRVVSIHCMNVPTSKTNHGYIGLQDFRGDVIREFERVGFIYHSEYVIEKDPVIAMQRTKALGLLHKQVLKDSCMSRQGIPDTMLQFSKGEVSDDVKGDYVTMLNRAIREATAALLPSSVVSFRKDGENPEPVKGPFERWYGDDQILATEGNPSINRWQVLANPIWKHIRPNHTLQYRSARSEDDGRHVCPAQLDAINGCIDMWTNEGDLVFDPFNGIGSTGHCALLQGRRYIGSELKESYFKQAGLNLEQAESEAKQEMLF